MNETQESKSINRTTTPDSNGSNNGTQINLGETEPVVTQYEEINVVKRKRPWKVLLPVLLLAVTLAVVGYLLFRPSKTVSTATVERGTIISTVETTGKLEAERSAKLAFKTSGRVEKVLVEQGDLVEEGNVLAELDTGSLQRQLNEAKTQLEISKLKLLQAKEGAQPADVAAATADLNGAIARLNQTRAGGRAEDIAAAQAQYNSAVAKLDAVKKGATPGDITVAQAQLDQAEANHDLVATTAANTTEQARILWIQAKGSTQDFLDPTGKVEQARLNYEAAKQNEVSQLKAADAKVTEAQQALNKVKAGATPEEIKQAEAGVALAKANLDKAKSGATPEEVKEAQSRVDAAQAALDGVKAGPTDTDIAILEQQINLAQLSVDSANAQLADARLVSPINGTVLTIDLTVGETVGSLQPVAVVADISTLRIRGDIDEIDVGRVRAGQAVTVTLDAYPGIKMPGRIDQLAPGATPRQGSTVYEASISFRPVEDVVPREGMAANVDITAQRKDNVLLLPNRAFETVGRRQYVSLKEGDGIRKIEVETGLSNTTDTEVISGLTEGQVVVLK